MNNNIVIIGVLYICWLNLTTAAQPIGHIQKFAANGMPVDDDEAVSTNIQNALNFDGSEDPPKKEKAIPIPFGKAVTKANAKKADDKRIKDIANKAAAKTQEHEVKIRKEKEHHRKVMKKLHDNIKKNSKMPEKKKRRRHKKKKKQPKKNKDKKNKHHHQQRRRRRRRRKKRRTAKINFEKAAAEIRLKQSHNHENNMSLEAEEEVKLEVQMNVCRAMKFKSSSCGTTVNVCHFRQKDKYMYVVVRFQGTYAKKHVKSFEKAVKNPKTSPLYTQSLTYTIDPQYFNKHVKKTKKNHHHHHHHDNHYDYHKIDIHVRQRYIGTTQEPNHINFKK